MFLEGKHRLDRSHEAENFTETYFVNPQPISIVDNSKDENEEEEYEEMEEEDDDEDDFMAFDFVDATGGRHEVESAVACGSYNTPQCVVCGRTPTPKTRLFKWPEDEQLRRSWCVPITFMLWVAFMPCESEDLTS
ncbi:hypothetical protein COOONC_16215 [Cooperia oncophora]